MTHNAEIQRATTPTGIELAFETFGDPADPPVLLVMGLGTQMLGWPLGFCAALVDRGLFVVRFDNRDVGLSTHVTDAPTPNPVAAFGGDFSSVAYTLSDMAADAIGLIDALGLDAVHLVGASLGGQIAQVVAIEHPERVRTLISIMSTTGDPAVGTPTEKAMGALLAPAARTRDEQIARSIAGAKVIGSPGFPFDEDAVRERAATSFDRAHDPVGVARQMLAAISAADRTPALRELSVPTLVIHGADDQLVQPSGGQAMADAVPGSELVTIGGMGHDLPRAVWSTIADHIARLVQHGEASVRGR